MSKHAETFWTESASLWLICLLLLSSLVTGAKQRETDSAVYSTRADANVEIVTDPASPFWRNARSVSAEVDNQGWRERGYRTEVRSRWTKNNIYFLFVCPYKHLYLNPRPDSAHETYELWKWNVAEVFIGSDFQNIKRYKEFEISPQGEWVDLDINLDNPHHEEGWVWNSGFEHAARIDESKHIWYAAMRIPFAALGVADAAVGQQFRVNFYRTEGEPPDTRAVMWRPTMGKTFHVPESFGLLKLAGK